MQFYTRKRRHPAINIVSLIDILCILLIFFIVTTTFKKDEPELQIDLPKSTQAQEAERPDEPMVIFLSKDGKILLQNAELLLSDLPARLRQLRSSQPNLGFVLRADQGVPLGLFVSVLDASKEAGIENLGLTTDPLPRDTP
ncbi:MAG: biopolymer transporter ExbD [Candidatus Methylacidiphilales bacterium]